MCKNPGDSDYWGRVRRPAEGVPPISTLVGAFQRRTWTAPPTRSSCGGTHGPIDRLLSDSSQSSLNYCDKEKRP